MPTFSMRTCSCRGFTLLELLVVIALAAIVTGTVALTIRGSDANQRLKGMADQLAYQIELARQYALQRNREWGIFLEDGEIHFAELDETDHSWSPQNQRPFGQGLDFENLRVRIEAEGFDHFSERERRKLPKILLLSSGEVTPFTIYLHPEGEGRGWTLDSDGLSVATVHAEEAD